MPIWLRAAVFLALFPAAIAGWLPWLVAMPRPAAAPGHEIGLIVIAIGWGTLLWCAREFARRGRGTPAPYDPPRALVTGGLYEVVRNPMYAGVLVAIFGWALWYWSGRVVLYGAFVALAFHARVLLYEEPVLSRAFGADFDSYRARVPRWFPRLTARRARG
jgi:protein-S-isoprenylcysteine O-methyltransferase Ste14